MPYFFATSDFLNPGYEVNLCFQKNKLHRNGKIGEEEEEAKVAGVYDET